METFSRRTRSRSKLYVADCGNKYHHILPSFSKDKTQEKKEYICVALTNKRNTIFFKTPDPLKSQKTTWVTILLLRVLLSLKNNNKLNVFRKK